jgi:hypothetical protein
MTVLWLLLLAALIPLLVCLGYRWAQQDLSESWLNLDVQREQLKIEWRTLDGVRRAQAIELWAVEAMREAAEHETGWSNPA